MPAKKEVVETKDIWAQLAEPFRGSDLEWRVLKSSKYDGRIKATIVPYVTARAIYDRLDSVLTPAGWSNEVSICGEGGNTYVMQKLTLKDKDGNVICSKMDGSDPTDIEAVKGGISGAIKRVAVLVGIGRYLYNTPWTNAVICNSNHPRAQWAKAGSDQFYWVEPESLEQVLSGEYAKQSSTPEKKEAVKPKANTEVQKPTDEQMELILEARTTAEKCIIDGTAESVASLKEDFASFIEDAKLSDAQAAVAWAPVERAWWERELKMCQIDDAPALILKFKGEANMEIIGKKYADEFITRARALSESHF